MKDSYGSSLVVFLNHRWYRRITIWSCLNIEPFETMAYRFGMMSRRNCSSKNAIRTRSTYTHVLFVDRQYTDVKCSCLSIDRHRSRSIFLPFQVSRGISCCHSDRRMMNSSRVSECITTFVNHRNISLR
jgi:hypothetical protein